MSFASMDGFVVVYTYIVVKHTIFFFRQYHSNKPNSDPHPYPNKMVFLIHVIAEEFAHY
jgi:hypothetical protein